MPNRVVRKFGNSGYFRKCCKTGQIEGTDAPDDPWDYPRKDDSNFWIRTPPPIYELNDEATNNNKTYSINGREYYIAKDESGDQRLIPIRTPSAYLFQYIH